MGVLVVSATDRSSMAVLELLGAVLYWGATIMLAAVAVAMLPLVIFLVIDRGGPSSNGGAR